MENEQLLIGFMSFTTSFDYCSTGGVGSRERPVRSYRYYLLNLEFDIELYHLEEVIIGFADIVDPDERLSMLRHADAISGIELHRLLRAGVIERLFVISEYRCDGFDIFRHYRLMVSRSQAVWRRGTY